MAENDAKSIDKGTLELLEKAAADGVNTAFDRADAMKPCPIGAVGSCCKNCGMGPCRVPLAKGKEETPEEKQKRRGICGATAETIAARNFIRMVAGGVAAHSDHGRGVAELFIAVAKGKAPGYEIKDEQKLLQVALDWGVEIGERTNNEIAEDIGRIALEEFGKQEGELITTSKAPLKRQEIWRKQGVMPRGIDREVVEIMHRTHIGVDQDYKNLLRQGARAAIADGWGGSMIATELQDILFGTPSPVLGTANLGVLREDEVNVIIHGHEPLLSEMIVSVAQEPEMLKLAKSKGAKGINLSGMCCTANEILMRHGVGIAGNFLQQELAIVTGAVDAMVVDVQCIFQSIATVAECYHTKIITTSPKAKIPGAVHIEFNEHDALTSARAIVKVAIENYPNRKGNIHIPDNKTEQIAGFSHETINYLLGGMFRASYRPLNDNIINGRIRGVAGVVGCNNARTKHNAGHIAMVKELIKNDVLVITTGCNAIACAEAGLLVPEAAKEYAGEGLAEVCETVGLPPVIHMGSCVDNSRILMAATAMVKDGGLGDDISDLPVAGAAPEWMSEKAISIGQYFVSSGVYTVFGVTWPTSGSKEVTDYLFKDMEELYGGMWDFEPDPIKAAQMMIAHIDKKRAALGIDKARERILYDMEMRRELDKV
ncbi:MAG: carbon-monoxide dehydrogenase catalytic subunit [Chloroflexi bacterium RBG_13_46_14]|nr:MAG: carbon-monoxide dehydrogenase catalytic subunit [Chloroflexi bacterium RBG_13_46_14]